MPVWEYKVISSGKGGFATPALLETFLNQLGKEDWEIIHYQSLPDNTLAFTGLARRGTQRDWTLEDAVAAAARAEAEKLRAELEAKFKGFVPGAAPEEKSEPAPEPDETGLRKLRNTDSDQDSEAEEEESGDWEKLAAEEELPTFFEAIQPLMRRNPKGSGMSVGVDQLAKKWHMEEGDVVGALKECGFAIPEDEDDKPVYLEYDGDLFWVNINRRGELWVNTKEKQRAMFRVAAGNKVVAEAGETAPAVAEAATDREVSPPAEGASASESGKHHGGGGLPEGEALLKRIRPMMRRGRGGAAGSSGFLSRALRCREADLMEAFKTLGLTLPEEPGKSSNTVELAGREWWLNRDQRGGVWINEGRRDERPNGGQEGEKAPVSGAPESSAEAAPAAGESGATPVLAEPPLLIPAESPAATAENDEWLAAIRPLLTPARSGALTGEICALGEALGRNPEKLLQVLSGLGLRVPAKPREKAVEVERAGLVYWLTRSAKDEIWLNTKAGGDDKKPRRGRRAASEPSEPAPSE